jgi:hypothetical protein
MKIIFVIDVPTLVLLVLYIFANSAIRSPGAPFRAPLFIELSALRLRR